MNKKIKLPRSKDRHGYTWEEMRKFMTNYEMLKFGKWFVGQTAMVNKKGDIIYYSHDVLRFLDLIRNGKQTYFD